MHWMKWDVEPCEVFTAICEGQNKGIFFLESGKFRAKLDLPKATSLAEEEGLAPSKRF